MTGSDISAPVLAWAGRRSGRDADDIRTKFADWDRWLADEANPTFSEVERIAAYTRVPLGYFFLAEPPDDRLPIPDFRVGRGRQLRASADLLETIYLNQRRQAWYEDYLADLGSREALPFVGSASTMNVVEAAQAITDALDYSVARRAGIRTFTEARAYLMAAFEDLGGLSVANSMVANNSHRMLNLDEFRGFTLHSDVAPLVFVNSHDTMRGQIFSLLHEFAHVWRGESGVSQGGDPLRERDSDQERWCDAVAAHTAVPTADLQANYQPDAELTEELDRLAPRYRCSSLVVLIRLRDTKLMPRDGFERAYQQEVSRLVNFAEGAPRAGGGQFYQLQPYRIGRTLSHAIVRDTRVGRTSMTQALRLLSFGRIPMFDKYAAKLGGSDVSA